MCCCYAYHNSPFFRNGVTVVCTVSIYVICNKRTHTWKSKKKCHKNTHCAHALNSDCLRICCYATFVVVLVQWLFFFNYKIAASILCVSLPRTRHAFSKHFCFKNWARHDRVPLPNCIQLLIHPPICTLLTRACAHQSISYCSFLAMHMHNTTHSRHNTQQNKKYVNGLSHRRLFFARVCVLQNKT